jgi:hypothetical protein
MSLPKPPSLPPKELGIAGYESYLRSYDKYLATVEKLSKNMSGAAKVASMASVSGPAKVPPTAATGVPMGPPKALPLDGRATPVQSTPKGVFRAADVTPTKPARTSPVKAAGRQESKPAGMVSAAPKGASRDPKGSRADNIRAARRKLTRKLTDALVAETPENRRPTVDKVFRDIWSYANTVDSKRIPVLFASLKRDGPRKCLGLLREQSEVDSEVASTSTKGSRT